MSVSPANDLLQEGLALHRRGAVDQAAARYAEVLRADPANADALYYLALISCQHGRFEEGAELARKSLASDPKQARSHVILGRALHALGFHDDALLSLDRATALAPELAPAHANRADVLSKIGRNAEALDSYDRALALAPDSVADWMNRGVALIALNRHDEAVTSFDRGFALNPDFVQADDFRAPRLLSKLRVCDWTDLAAETARLLAMVRAGKPLSLPFAIVAIPSSPAEQLQCARRYVQEEPAYAPLWQGEAYAHDRIRVAYLSADFNEHPTAYLTAGLFEQHDKSRFEITALSFGPNDNSPPRRRLEAAFEHFIDVGGNTDQEIAALMRRAEIDIAVDLMGFTKDHRLGVLARRAAPIQVSYLGYPGTMGAPYMDYILADATVIPEDHDAFYAERVVRLPGTYQINDNRRAISQHTPTRGECGLPQNGFVFCCFNNPQKITPEIFDIWMRLLRATEGSALWLITGNAKVAANLRAEADKRGVAAERLIFAPKASVADHLARHRLADLCLDTLPYNAHTTASDALWAGLPVLTCLGETFAGRVAASLLKAIGLDELITGTLAEYEALALRLSRDPVYLASLKDRLIRNRDASLLFDTQRASRHIETAYQSMAEIARRNEKPRSFNVQRT
ncbi:MAG TPA: tetratricopeptide repeat protein [Xanthobacteraceae bacterium]|nr:tetratricopeptide repeat protein [Xanthobacteraceae bacterium]